MAYIKLKGASNFWDPTQSNPDSRKLVSGQVKDLEETKKVIKFMSAGAIQIAKEEEFIAYQKKAKAESDALKGLKSDAKDVKELKTSLKAKDDQLKENSDIIEALKAENEALKKATEPSK